MAAGAAMSVCALMLVSGTGVANAQSVARLTQVVPLSGTVTKGGSAFKGKQVNGTYTIERFVSSGGKLYSVGTFTGKVGNKKLNKSNVPPGRCGEQPDRGLEHHCPQRSGAVAVAATAGG